MNYPLRDAIIGCVRDGNTELLADTVARQCRNYPENVLHSLMNGLGTHDTERILTALSGAGKPAEKRAMESFRLEGGQMETAKKRLRLASLLQFTLPGVPCVFYGDEAGMEGWTDPFNRRCYPWGGEDAEMIAWYAALSKLRSDRECFKNGKYRLAQAHAGVFAFVRGQGNGRVLIAANCSDSDRTLNSYGFNYDLLKNEYSDSLTVKAGKPAIFAINERGPG
jgi:glycosidase